MNVKHKRSTSSSTSTYILDILSQTGRAMQNNASVSGPSRDSRTIPRARSGSSGLAAQTGWIGSVARFWEVQSRDTMQNQSVADAEPLENICAGLCRICVPGHSISPGMKLLAWLQKFQPLTVYLDCVLCDALPPNVLHKQHEPPISTCAG